MFRVLWDALLLKKCPTAAPDLDIAPSIGLDCLL